jgi:hypothetical protein
MVVINVAGGRLVLSRQLSPSRQLLLSCQLLLHELLLSRQPLAGGRADERAERYRGGQQL